MFSISIPHPQSPIEQLEETNSSGQKEDEEGSEDESDEKNESVSHDPERLKAFNVSSIKEKVYNNF